MENPPSIFGVASFGSCGSCSLLAFAKPTSLQYSTQPLNTNQITIVKQMGHAESLRGVGADYDDVEKQENETNKSSSVTSAIAGYGIVTVKRSVHGYKKLSHVNRIELSRTSISVPPMEFDTRALWIDADAACLRDVVLDFDGGVHALSHAMVAVAPLFVACAIADIDCDHSTHSTTQILLYDQRAGGSGVTAQLYYSLLSALRAAIELLEECTSCYSSKEYDGGCPACLQSVPCDNFHQTISRYAGVLIGKHLVNRLEKSTFKNQRETNGKHLDGCAIDVQCPLKPNNIVIGRAPWSPKNTHARWAEVDDA
jgi:DEAD/DEAH box helicase domain-containing protein